MTSTLIKRRQALVSSCDPFEDERPARPARASRSHMPAIATADDLEAAAYRAFKADMRDTLCRIDPKTKLQETKEQAFARRWHELPPLARTRWMRIASAVLAA